ncbi:SDR family NAD(P)-dependent oxidoreductase [uncultured Cohaesibacter sp.]|uniref:SDR family NAD(P)-dependent oxidoreductase n=1 Tax=uncultured Cohaesibacter sp. TaxID=1002546 RepID=UPI0029C805B7|nr:SDR family NAD(P)-dependent oxidoreductase [uncultured Cohaesibacter sp.]
MRTILITGASRGLGAALAKAYAAPNVRLFLTARRAEALRDVANNCREKGAEVLCFELDLLSEASIDGLLAAVERAGWPDMAFANAGVYSGRRHNGNLEPWPEQYQQLVVNLVGTIRLMDALASQMKRRGSGHLLLVSSLAALQPQPDSPAYSASKAGIAVWSRAMAEDLASFGVKVGVIYPGHIESEQTAIHVGALPGILPAEKAAKLIQKQVARGKHRIIFPRHIHWLIIASNLLPGWLRRRANRPFRYHVRGAGEAEKENRS